MKEEQKKLKKKFRFSFIILIKNLSIDTIKKIIIIISNKIFLYILFQKVPQFSFQFVVQIEQNYTFASYIFRNSKDKNFFRRRKSSILSQINYQLQFFLNEFSFRQYLTIHHRYKYPKFYSFFFFFFLFWQNYKRHLLNRYLIIVSKRRGLRSYGLQGYTTKILTLANVQIYPLTL